MNFFFLESHYVDLSVQQLRSMASFRNLRVGDLVLLRIDLRLVLAIVNHQLEDNAKLTTCSMIAEVFCEDKILPNLLPILYYYDYRRKICDKNGLQSLLYFFRCHQLASKFILETLALASGEIYQRNAELVFQLLQCTAIIPYDRKKSVLHDVVKTLKEGKLLIVEKFFTVQMKQEFYNNLVMGLSERESFVKLRRKYPKFFSRILVEFGDRDIYTRI